MEASEAAELAAERGYQRFCRELEMVQALAYPAYLHQLAKHGILDQPEFVAYLEYLQYWRQPAYARFIVYPLSLHMLEMLQTSTFRASMKNEQAVARMADQLLRHWATWRQAPSSTDLSASVSLATAPN